MIILPTLDFMAQTYDLQRLGYRKNTEFWLEITCDSQFCPNAAPLPALVLPCLSATFLPESVLSFLGIFCYFIFLFEFKCAVPSGFKGIVSSWGPTLPFHHTVWHWIFAEFEKLVF